MSKVYNYYCGLVEGKSKCIGKTLMGMFAISICWYIPFIPIVVLIGEIYKHRKTVNDKLIFSPCHPGAKVPVRGSPDAAGLDIYCIMDDTIPSGTRKLISTGLKLKYCPENSYIRIAPRSGLSCKGIDICAGVVDRDYRGEVKVLLCNNSHNDFVISKNSRIAQFICEKIVYVTPSIPELKDVTETISLIKKRAEGGFGSTG
jgi:dUTP pyrophosphatase